MGGLFPYGVFEQAKALGHRWFGEEHVLLAALTDGPFLGLTYEEAFDDVAFHLGRDEPFGPEATVGVGSAPSYHDIVGRATGFALGSGATRPTAHHVWPALVWDPTGSTSKLLTGGGLTRREVLDGAGPLGRLVPDAPAVNPLPDAAEREAVAIGHGFSGHEHLLLALLAGQPDDRAGRLLRGLGLDHGALAVFLVSAWADAAGEPADPTRATPNPRFRQVFGAAEGLAATLGDGVVRSTDALVAYLWQEDGQQLFAIEHQGVSGPSVVEALVADGVRVPEAVLPEPDRVPWGEQVPIPPERRKEIVARVEERYPSSPGRPTCIGGRDWLVAKAHIDLRSIVKEVVAGS